jgi:hypothetical protein
MRERRQNRAHCATPPTVQWRRTLSRQRGCPMPPAIHWRGSELTGLEAARAVSSPRDRPTDKTHTELLE